MVDSIHSQAWTDPYFQVDWAFDGKPQICKNCHIPLDRQQEHKVVGFKDQEKWQPILAPNPAFDAQVCSTKVSPVLPVIFAMAKSSDPLAAESAAHPVEKLANPNEVCFKCHVVGGNRWDTFFRFPPCGTVAEIQKHSRRHKRHAGRHAGCYGRRSSRLWDGWPGRRSA